MLKLPHVAPLTEYVRELREEDFGDVPYFDPMDGGTKAAFLFLLEKPGPMASSSGFISRNNNDPTAMITYNFMKEAGIDRATTCLEYRSRLERHPENHKRRLKSRVRMSPQALCAASLPHRCCTGRNKS